MAAKVGGHGDAQQELGGALPAGVVGSQEQPLPLGLKASLRPCLHGALKPHTFLHRTSLGHGL